MKIPCDQTAQNSNFTHNPATASCVLPGGFLLSDLILNQLGVWDPANCPVALDAYEMSCSAQESLAPCSSQQSLQPFPHQPCFSSSHGSKVKKKSKGKDNRVRKEPAEGGGHGSFPVELLPDPITLFLRSVTHKIRKQVLGFFFFFPYRTTQAAVLPGARMLSQNYWSALRYHSWRLQLSSWEKCKLAHPDGEKISWVTEPGRLLGFGGGGGSGNQVTKKSRSWWLLCCLTFLWAYSPSLDHLSLKGLAQPVPVAVKCNFSLLHHQLYSRMH